MSAEFERMWSSMASSIVGSGTYALEGTNEIQVKRLAECLAVVRQKAYERKAEYASLYERWRARLTCRPVDSLVR